MITSEITIRIRYDEVDKMGYVYHGNYAKYYHVGRTELLRKLGICDKELEKLNILLPVIEMTAKFIKPVYYDETITVSSSVIEKPVSRIKFEHIILNQNDEIVHKAYTTLAFVEEKTRKPRRVPDIISNKLELFINLINQ